MAKVNITQVRSRIGATKIQRSNLDALGLRKIGKTVQHEDSKTIMGMIEKVRHLVKIEMNAAPLAKQEPKKAPAPKAQTEDVKAPLEQKTAEEKPAAEKKPAARKPAAPKSAKPAAEKKPAAKKTNE